MIRSNTRGLYCFVVSFHFISFFFHQPWCALWVCFDIWIISNIYIYISCASLWVKNWSSHLYSRSDSLVYNLVRRAIIFSQTVNLTYWTSWYTIWFIIQGSSYPVLSIWVVPDRARPGRSGRCRSLFEEPAGFSHVFVGRVKGDGVYHF